MMKHPSLILRCGTMILATCFSGFASATDLVEAYQAALSHDSDFLAVRASREESEGGIDLARSALLPQLSYSYQKNRAETKTHYLTGGRGDTDTGEYSSKSSGLSLRQPLFRLPAWEALKAAKAQAEAAEATLKKERQSLGLRVGSAYFGILAAREGVSLAESQTRAYDGTLALAERWFASGRGTRTDVEDARSRRDLAKAQVTDARVQLSEVLREFETLTGLEAKSVADFDLTLLNPELIPLEKKEDLLARIATSNPEVLSLGKQLEAAQASVAQARAGHLPTVDLVAAHQRNESDTNTTVGTAYRTNYIGIQVSVPLLSGGPVLAQTRQAIAREERSRQSLESARRKTLSDAAHLYDKVMQGREQVEAYSQAMRSAEQAIVGDRKGFEAGTRTIVDALDSERRLFEVMRERASAVISFATNRLRLLGLADSIDEDAIRTLNAWLLSAKK